MNPIIIGISITAVLCSVLHVAVRSKATLCLSIGFVIVIYALLISGVAQ